MKGSMRLQTEVLIIGGGATGGGIARDLSLRGIPSLLIEREDFLSGASGRNHGLFHSGGRYVVSDPEAARERHALAVNGFERIQQPAMIEYAAGQIHRFTTRVSSSLRIAAPSPPRDPARRHFLSFGKNIQWEGGFPVRDHNEKTQRGDAKTQRGF